MTSRRLDTQGLLGELADPHNDSFEALAAGTVMGHVHLKVASIAATVAFYRDVLGFGLMVTLGAQAAFLSAGGYHHHIGANTWESASGAPPPAGAAALRHATILLPDTSALEALRARLTAHGIALIEQDETSVLDPSGIMLRFEIAPPGA
jgi:catechol 2,3-dioxygenase